MQPKLCILAGGGRLPALLIDACEAAARPFCVIAFQGQADPAEFPETLNVCWHRLGAGHAIIEEVKKMEAQEVVLAGAISRPGLFSLMPDLWTLRVLIRTRALSKGDDGLLRVVAGLFEREGICVVGISDVAPELLTPPGVLTKYQPDDNALLDIEAARNAAQEIGRRDIGQAVIARGGQVIAREDKRGTDAMLLKINNTNGPPAGVLVKCVKPGQDRRIDLPTIGMATIQNAVTAGLKGIALDAGASLIVDKVETIKAAEDAGMFIVGIEDE